MQIHLSKPGGQKEGPFTIEQINQALASGRLQGSDYWAWYEGLAEWVPLSSVPGIQPHSVPAGPEKTKFDTQFLSAPAVERAGAKAESPTAWTPEAEIPAQDVGPMTAGMPFSALEQIFILTTGEGQAASRSAVTIALLREVIGEDWETIRQFVPRDAIGKCGILNEMQQDRIPPMIWRAMTAFKPVLLQQAKEGSHRICIRSFRIETGDLVAVFLFYNKAKLK